MLNSQVLIDKICAKIACGGMTDLETCQTTGALNLLSSPVVSVSTFSALPNASLFAGRMVYVDDENRYYYSLNGLLWISDFKSQLSTISSVNYSWGHNNNRQLGDGTSTNRTSPVSVVGGFTDWCQVSMSGIHALAVRTNGTLWAWGGNGYGQLGDGTSVTKCSPVSVVGGFNDWCQVSAASGHSLAVRQNGTLWAWGSNYRGRLGDGTVVSKSSPVSVVGGFTDWCQVSAGDAHSLAVRQNGTLWAWGCNNCGQLGDGTLVSKSSPASVVGGFTDWCQASAGYGHSLAIRQNGTLWAWGCNFDFQLGNLGVAFAISSPVSVVGGFTDWCQVSAGFRSTHAVRTNGTLWSWGRNNYGQLGDGTTIGRCSPVSVIGGFANWCQVSAGSFHAVAVRTNGTLWAWGRNSYGQLGDGSGTLRSSPVSVVGGFTGWGLVDAGGNSAIAIQRLTKGF